MKKRMFLSTILMTLVLLVALTTATFAWYSATTSEATFVGDTTKVTTSDSTFSVGALTFTLDLGPATANVGPTDQEGNIYVIIDNKEQLIGQKIYEKSGSFSWTVTATVADNNLTLSQALASLNGTSYTVTFEGPNVRLSVASGDAAIAAANDANATVTFSVSGGQLVNASGTVYFAVDSTVTSNQTECTVAGSISKKQ